MSSAGFGAFEQPSSSEGGAGSGGGGIIPSTGGSPQIAAGPAAGSNPSATLLSGRDFAGVVQFVPGAGADDSGALVTITFSVPLGPTGLPQVVLYPENPPAALVDFEVTGESPTGFGISCVPLPPVGLPGLTFQLRYLVLVTN